MKLSEIASTVSDAAAQIQPGTSSFSSRWRIFVSSTNVRVNCGSAFTSGAGIAGSSGRYTGTPSRALPSCRRSIVFQSPYTGTGFVDSYVPGPVSSRRSTTRPPPCHDVIWTQFASSATSAGSIRTCAVTSRFGAGCVSVSATVAR